MTFAKLPSLLGLLVFSSTASLVACDSQSLGDEPTDTATDSGTGGDPISAESEQVGQLEGGAFHHVAVRDDGSIIAAGLSGYQGTFGDLAIFDAHWVGAFAANGGLLWSQEIPVPMNEFGEYAARELTAVSVGPDGSVFLSIVDYANVDDSDNEVSKLAADGTPLWTTILPAQPRAVAATSDGGALVGGLAASETDPNAVDGWAVRLDSSGAVAGFVWLDDDLQTQSERRLPASGATDGVLSLRAGGSGELVAQAALGGAAIVTLSQTGDVLSTAITNPDYVTWSPYSPTAYLGGERSNCSEELGGDACGTTIFYGFDGGETQWEATFDCNAITGHAVDATESIVSLGCPGDGDTLTAELHRIVVN